MLKIVRNLEIIYLRGQCLLVLNIVDKTAEEDVRVAYTSRQKQKFIINFYYRNPQKTAGGSFMFFFKYFILKKCIIFFCINAKQ